VQGVEVSGAAALWNLTESGLLNVSLQPNYLPVNLVLLVQWELDESPAKYSIEMPQPLVDQLVQDLWVAIPDDLPLELMANSPSDSMQPLNDSQLLGRWVSLLVSSVNSQVSSKPNELRTWLVSWHPNRFGFSPDAIIDRSWIEPLKRDLDEDEDGQVALFEFWQGLVVDPAGIPNALGNSEAGRIALDGKPRDWVVLTGNRLTFAPPDLRERLMPRALAAVLLAAVAVLALLVASRLKRPYFEVLSTHPWFYWLQLAVIAWLLFPVAWPSWLIAIVSMAMLVSQLADRRGRRTPHAA
jgi:hypothetical protein